MAETATTVDIWRSNASNFMNTRSAWASGSNYATNDGFDLIWRQAYLKDQMTKVETDIRDIEKNANLSDTEKMFAMQMAMNTWSAISNLRTNMLKSVSDTLKSIARNVA